MSVSPNLPDNSGGSRLRVPISNRKSLSHIARNLALPLALGISGLITWELVARVFAIPVVFLPPPTLVARSFVQTFPILVEQAIPTTEEVVGGFCIAVAVGMLLAALMVYSERAKATLYPNLVAVQLIPKIALAPLFIVWLGIGSASRLAFAFFISVFPIIIATTNGLVAVERDLLRFCQSLSATRSQVLFLVRLPFGLPHIFAGFKIAITMALLGAITGEFVTAQEGLGYIIIFATSRSETPLMMAAIIMLCLIGSALYGLVVVCELALKRAFSLE
jgi:NitT/TauT family transport system permease protein